MSEEKEKQAQSCEIRFLKEKDIPAVASVYLEAFNKAGIGEKWIQETAEDFMRWWFESQPDLLQLYQAEYPRLLCLGMRRGPAPEWCGVAIQAYEAFRRSRIFPS